MPCRNVSQIRKTCTHSQFEWFCYRHGSEKTSMASLGNTLAKESIHTKNVTERSKRLEPKKNKKNTQKYLLALLAGGRLYTDLSPLIHLAACWTKSCDFQLPKTILPGDHPTRRPSYQVLPLRAGECLQILSDAIAE